MRQNQKYFPLSPPAGSCCQNSSSSPICASLIPRPIVSGNERVVRPRLEDARFSFNQDLKTRLEARVPSWRRVHKQARQKLERMQRIKLLAGRLRAPMDADVMQAEAPPAFEADWSPHGRRISRTQGVNGALLRAPRCEPREVAMPIEQHLPPRFSGDKLPETPIAVP